MKSSKSDMRWAPVPSAKSRQGLASRTEPRGHTDVLPRAQILASSLASPTTPLLYGFTVTYFVPGLHNFIL